MPRHPNRPTVQRIPPLSDISNRSPPYGSPSLSSGGETEPSSDALRWATSSDWDNATSENNVSHPSDDITMGSSGWSDGFEDGDMSEWTVHNSNYSTTTSPVHNGSYSFGVGDTSATSIADRVVWSGGQQISEFVYYWQEKSTSWGGGIRLQNSNGNWECGAASNNPEWDVWGSGGATEFYAGDGYERWIKFRFVFDWSNGVFDIYGEDLSSGSTASMTGLGLRNGVDIESIHFDQYSGGTWNGGGDVNMYIDDLSGGEASSGHLTTATKSFSSSEKPNLHDVNYALNGGGIDVSVIGSPGTTSEETQTVTITGGESDYGLSWGSGHTDFRVRTDLSRGSSAPTLRGLEVSPLDVAGSAIITDGLVSRYRFEQDLSDETGNYPLSAPSTAPNYVSGKDGSYAADASNGSYVDSSTYYDVDAGEDITVCYWIRDDGTATAWDDDKLFGVDSDGDGFGSFCDTNGVPFIYTSGDNTKGNGSTSVLDGNWHHVAFVYLQSSDTMELYIDGSKEYGISYTDDLTNVANSSIHFWNNSDGSHKQYDGDMDDHRIYKRGLSASEVSDISNLNG